MNSEWRDMAAYVARLERERDSLAAALRDVLRMCDEIARADHENRCAYYGAGEIGDVARAALAKLDGKP